MDGRERRGLEILMQQHTKIRRTTAGWFVPSQSGYGKYAVTITADRQTCTCPDHEVTGQRCKHIWCVEHVLQQTFHFEGEQVTETLRVTKTVRTTYPQRWREYNAAQTGEKAEFLTLLRDLCGGIADAQPARPGRPRLPLSDVIFSAVFKVYSTLSGRRFMTDLRDAHARGMLTKVPHYNSIFNYLESADLTPVLYDLIARSSLPLRAVERDFAVDSTGFSTSKFTRWFDQKYGKEQARHDWVKVHVMSGVKTNVVTAVEIQDKNAADSPQLPYLVETTAENFKIGDVSADRAYVGIENMHTIYAVGGEPFIAFKRSNTGASGGALEKAFHYFMYRREEFLQHYHKRSNVESTFSMIKRKFGDALRSKTPTAMVNEALCKLLCHNLVVLIHEAHELGVAPIFGGNGTAAQQLPA